MRFSAVTGLDFVRAYKENVRFDKHGNAVLASRNLLRNPRLENVTPSGIPAGWEELEAAPSPIGQHLYARRGAARFARQTQNILPADEARAYFHSRHDSSGSAPPDPGARPEYPVPDPPLPTSTVFTASGGHGLPAGQYYESYAWIGGYYLFHDETRFLTAPGPNISFTLAAGEAYIRALPTEGPALANGLALLLSKPNGSANQLYVYRDIDISGRIPEYYAVDGPIRWDASNLAPTANETYRGAFNTYPAPTYRIRAAGNRTLQAFDTQVSYYTRTYQGLGASQQTRSISVARKKGACVALIFERDTLWGQGAWVMVQILGADGVWYDLHYLRFGHGGMIPAPLLRGGFEPLIYTDDPRKLPVGCEYDMVPSARRREDQSGLRPPDVPLEPIVRVLPSDLTAARYGFRLTDVYQDEGRREESAPSALFALDAGANDVIRLDLPQSYGNRLPNASFAEKTRTSAVRGWTLGAGARLENSTVYADTTSTVAFTVATSSAFPTKPGTSYTVRGIPVRTSGDGGIAIRLNYRTGPTGSTTSTSTVISIANGLTEATVTPPAGADYATLDVRATIGATQTSPGRVEHLGVFEGAAAPRKRTKEAIQNETEPLDGLYPTGSYITILRNPSWSVAKGHGVEYFGVAFLAARRERFLYGLEMPVEENQSYQFSAYYDVVGSAAETELMPLTVRDEDGVVLSRPGAVWAGSGSASGRGTVAIATPPSAAYVRIESSRLGAGRVRAWGFQLEVGTTATAWTDDFWATGILAVTFDTAPPGLPMTDAATLLATIFDVKRFLDAGAIADTPPGTSVGLRFRGRESSGVPYSTYSSDPNSVAGKRIVEVEATLNGAVPTTENPRGSTPEVSEVFLDAEHKRAILFDADGNHYPGGVYVEGVPATQYGENAELLAMSDGRGLLQERHEAQKILTGFSLHAYSDAGAHAVMQDSTRGERLFVLEGWGYRRVVRMLNIVFGVDRYTRFAEGYHAHLSEEVSAEIISEEPLE